MIFKTVAITTLGCKVNQFESASFITGFKERGLAVVDFSQRADIYVINSCAVTGKAGAQSRQMIRRALRLNPQARIVATGCYSQVAHDEIRALADHPILVVGNSQKHRLVAIALEEGEPEGDYLGDIAARQEICDLPVRESGGRTRAYVKIQDGCDNFCSYCIVPYARGRVRSLPPKRVMAQLDAFRKAGYRELVLTGIHVGCYGRDLRPRTDLTALVREIAERDDGMRYRISSLEPGELSPEMLAVLGASPKFMPHFHLPLQSGDDSILKRMNRHYQVRGFRETVGRITKVMPQAAIGLDVVVGFPGEDEAAFANTYRLIEELPISYLHVFPFSRRPGTKAWDMDGQVEKEIKDERAARLRALGQKKRLRFYQSHIGEVRTVLAERFVEGSSTMKGFTDNYIPVHFAAPAGSENHFFPVCLQKLEEDGTVVGCIEEGL